MTIKMSRPNIKTISFSDKKKKIEPKKEKKYTIYVLECKHGKKYVGKTLNDVKVRFQQHVDGYGSSWTTKHKPIKILKRHKEKSMHDENNTTIECMMEYGIENVRGGTFTELFLPEHQFETIKQMIASIKNECYLCGNTGHYAESCAFRKEHVTVKEKA